MAVCSSPAARERLQLGDSARKILDALRERPFNSESELLLILDAPSRRATSRPSFSRDSPSRDACSGGSTRARWWTTTSSSGARGCVPRSASFVTSGMSRSRAGSRSRECGPTFSLHCGACPGAAPRPRQSVRSTAHRGTSRVSLRPAPNVRTSYPARPGSCVQSLGGSRRGRPLPPQPRDRPRSRARLLTLRG